MWKELLQFRPATLVVHEFIENGQYLLAVLVKSLQVILESIFILPAPHPFPGQRRGYIDIPSDTVDRMAAQKEPVE